MIPDDQIDNPMNKPAFNLAVSTINRINLCLIKFADSFYNNDLTGSIQSLKLVYQEIYPFLKKDEVKEVKDLIIKIDEELSSISQTNQVAPQNKRILGNNKLIEFVTDFSLLLRRLAHKNKLYMLMSDDPRFSMGGKSFGE